MNEYLLALIIISEMVSVFLLYKVWRSKEYLILKALGTLIGLIPFFGPFMIFFIFGMPANQRIESQNTGPRGEYTHSWIGERNFWKSVIKEKKTKNGKHT